MKLHFVNIIKYIWQLPQNITGLIVIFLTGAKKDFLGVYTTDCKIGVSLGSYIIVNKYCSYTTILHERGHQRQSLYLGWLYLLVIGLPSAAGNLLHRIINFNYYLQPWEKWADKLGGVKRGAE